MNEFWRFNDYLRQPNCISTNSQGPLWSLKIYTTNYFYPIGWKLSLLFFDVAPNFYPEVLFVFYYLRKHISIKKNKNKQAQTQSKTFSFQV